MCIFPQLSIQAAIFKTREWWLPACITLDDAKYIDNDVVYMNTCAKSIRQILIVEKW